MHRLVIVAFLAACGSSHRAPYPQGTWTVPGGRLTLDSSGHATLETLLDHEMDCPSGCIHGPSTLSRERGTFVLIGDRLLVIVASGPRMFTLGELASTIET